MRGRALALALVLFGCPAVKPAINDAGTGGGGGGVATGGGSGGGSGGGGGVVDAGTDAGVQSICGNGVVTGLESCDDGALGQGDGCSATCSVETGWFCQLPPPGQPSSCVPNCGDGRLVANEPCDDGNFRNNDGCTSTCQLEPGFSCTGAPSVCRVTCGDGIVGGTEVCDDGNMNSSDGCSSTCAQEPGFTCLGSASVSVCRPTCGDGLLVTGEVCDDGFTDACGACNSNCMGVGAGSSCGDGVRCPQTEQCDDNNMVSNDGCSSTCTIDADAGIDAGVGVDSGVVDSGVDAGVVDSGVPDAGVPDAGGTQPLGVFAYQKIPNFTYVDDFTRVMWHPSGRFALLLGVSGKVIRYDATARTLALEQTVGTSLADLDVAPDGSYFLVVGMQSTVPHLWKLNVSSGDVISAAADQGTLTGSAVRAISREGNNARFAIVTRAAAQYINYLYLYTTAAGLGAAKGYNAGASAMTVMWGSPALTGGSANVMTGDGENGADSKTWVESSNIFVANTWSPGFGNPGGGGWQPGGGWGAFCGWSSDKLYVYDGAWALLQLPAVNNGVSPQALAFRADGKRGLVVGRPSGAPLRGSVFEYRANGSNTAVAADFSDVSIGNFNATPWFGNLNEYLMDVAWRPGTCDEGLIVGMDNGSSLSPTFGLAIRFYDTSQATCAP